MVVVFENGCWEKEVVFLFCVRFIGVVFLISCTDG